MRQLAAILSVIMAAVTACSLGGDRDDPRQKPAKPAAEKPTSPTEPIVETGVGISLREQQPYQTRRVCVEPAWQASLELDAKALPRIDGELGDWSGRRPLAGDRRDDHHGSVDLGKTLVGVSGDNLYVALRASSSEGWDETQVAIEWGGLWLTEKPVPESKEDGGKGEDEEEVSPPRSDLHERTLRELRVRGGLVEIKWQGTWQTIDDPRLIEVAAGSDGIELRISRYLIGEVLAYPVWWLRAAATSSDGSVSDFSAPTYRPSLLPAGQPAFHFAGCAAERSTYNGVALTEMTDAGLDAELGERMLGIARMALFRTMRTIGRREFPVGSVTLLATRAESPERPDVTQSIPASMENLAIRLDASLFDPEQTTSSATQDVFVTATRALLELYFADLGKTTVSAFMREALLTAAMSRIVRDDLGFHHWAVRLRDDIDSWHEADRKKSSDRATRRARAFGYLIEHAVTVDKLLSAWRSAIAQTDQAGDDALRAAILAQFPLEEQGRITRLWSGWVTEGSYDREFAPALLDDPDRDGLPTFFEMSAELDPKKPDTDGDGWTDFSEIYNGSDAKNAINHPGLVVVDGSFGDWLDLLPGRITADQGANTIDCPAAADLAFYAAIATERVLFIGAQAMATWEGGEPVTWEVALDLPAAEKQLLLRAVSGERFYDVVAPQTGELIKRFPLAMPLGRNVAEFALDFNSLGIEGSLLEANAVKVRLTLLYAREPKKSCDETPWFAPLISRWSE